MGGKDYAKVFNGRRMRRRDYELSNMSFDNIRPFYRSTDQHADSSPQIYHDESFTEEESELYTLKREISKNLLVNKPVGYTQEHNDFSKAHPDTKGDERVKLPKLRQNLTLHLTTHGPTVIQPK